jgi:hypothetical protein
VSGRAHQRGIDDGSARAGGIDGDLDMVFERTSLDPIPHWGGEFGVGGTTRELVQAAEPIVGLVVLVLDQRDGGGIGGLS